MHERGLDQPLEVLVACDGIEAGDNLTGPCHCKLLGYKRKINSLKEEDFI